MVDIVRNGLTLFQENREISTLDFTLAKADQWLWGLCYVLVIAVLQLNVVMAWEFVTSFWLGTVNCLQRYLGYYLYNVTYVKVSVYIMLPMLSGSRLALGYVFLLPIWGTFSNLSFNLFSQSQGKFGRWSASLRSFCLESVKLR